MQQFLKTSYLILVGGVLYAVVETIWRGYTHWTMILVGGLCFVAVLLVNGLMPERAGLLLRGVAGAVVVTALEFVSGAVLNLWLGLGVWDYSAMPMNLLGQVCLPFSLGWAILCVPVVLLGDFLESRLFGVPSRRYTLLTRPATQSAYKAPMKG